MAKNAYPNDPFLHGKRPKDLPSVADTHAFWRGDPGKPADYLAVNDGRSAKVVELMKRCEINGPILELGCNCGRNLDALWQAGFRELSGIEINEDAVLSISEAYPEMATDSKIYNLPMEDALPALPTGSLEAVFSLAVLMHLSPRSEWVFDHIARVSSKFIITLEHEHYDGSYFFARNYAEVFKPRGFECVYEEQLLNMCVQTETMMPYTARCLRRCG